MGSQTGVAEQGDLAPKDETWRLDLCYLWEEKGARSRYLVSWAPSAGFFTSDDTIDGLKWMGGVVTPEGIEVVWVFRSGTCPVAHCTWSSAVLRTK